MKKRIIALLLAHFMLVPILCACGEGASGTQSVVIGEKEYILCYERGYLFPQDQVVAEGEPVATVRRRKFYKVEDCEFDCLVSYKGLYPDIYFSAEDYESAEAYYDDSENYSYYCHVGNLYDDGRTYPADGIDTDRFEELYEYALKKEQDYTARDSRDIPFDDESDYTAGELRFYKESLDGLFCTYKGLNFRIEDEKLVMLDHYYFDYGGENTTMSVFDMPEELGDYFIEFYRELLKLSCEEF